MSRINHVIGAEIETLQRETFGYFQHEVNSVNGLVIDKTAPDSPASIAATGFALAAYPVGVERGFISRAAAVERTLTTLRFFQVAPRTGTRRDRLSELLLPFSGYANRTTRRAM